MQLQCEAAAKSRPPPVSRRSNAVGLGWLPAGCLAFKQEPIRRTSGVPRKMIRRALCELQAGASATAAATCLDLRCEQMLCLAPQLSGISCRERECRLTRIRACMRCRVAASNGEVRDREWHGPV